MASRASQLKVCADTADAVSQLTVDGILDSSTYLTLRNTVIKAALDQPAAVLVDVTALDVPGPSAWSVFTSARWHVSVWPGVPVLLVCADGARRVIITRNGIARYVPVYPSVEAALQAVTPYGRRARRRMRVELHASPASLRHARELVAESLAEWSQAGLIPVATVIVNVFVENVLQHTESAPVLRLETDGTTVTVAVQDGSANPALRRESSAYGRDQVSGLAIVAAVCRAWGSTPLPSGKTVWALIGPENRL